MAQSNANLETSPISNNQANSQPDVSRDADGIVDVTPGYRPPRSSREKQQNGSQNNGDGEPRRLGLADLFKPKDGSEVPNNDEDVEDDPTKLPDSIEALSRRLQMKPEQVYSIKVPMRDGGEAITIGDLKDRVGELVDLETREQQFDQRRIKQEGELLRAQSEMRDVLGMLPKEVVQQLPQLIDKVRKRHDATRVEENRRALDVIPDWEDDTRRAQDLEGMSKFLSEWGFDESFITTIVDHRAMKFVRDMYLRDAKIKKALASVTIPQKRGHRPSSKPTKPAAKPSTATSRRERVAPDQQSRIMAFLNRE